MDALDQQFHNLHQNGLLILANVADAAGARIVQQLGSQAVATSSAAVAWLHGYKDGNALPLERLVATVESIARVISVPLTVDIEAGYSDDLEQVARVIDAVIAAGAVGINIEDGFATPELLVRKIEMARQVAQRRNVRLFINARTDVYLKNLVPAEDRVAETLKRAALYRAAGADGLFAAGVTAAYEIAAICQDTPLPVNVLGLPCLPSPEELRALGVRRLTAGSSIAELLYGAMQSLAKSFLETGKLDSRDLKAFTYGEVNALLDNN
ncbi:MULTISPECIES: isocitrate lyase/phosphoenolpyruvate mutase family protein [unclassified Pseudomonas]|uniref:isocitrate lyase/PEP mutase family protein n=1 Tax=unclassified Pseudomonas TaxID=196821 RepID=UPI002AC97522|nr:MULTISPECIES: isocitrate lyase/phosphoenolpyruvate mutase family protein [unclassified Pseudomonas]MEB0045224.1 isocitrate lyase/phosphoenolpyruvate mutase family protein [Pseudomonas sp. Dout3]MEB0096420.1 isocitrate lyase/phosphoenolpyruvate mutase family protein [Pseudomonas sp. DC1.2]WPX61376.1 isocitrate lyase/phosphoenolpyruvate mutase family protein [Pseudomonas sp. DC1.2]